MQKQILSREVSGHFRKKHAGRVSNIKYDLRNFGETSFKHECLEDSVLQYHIHNLSASLMNLNRFNNHNPPFSKVLIISKINFVWDTRLPHNYDLSSNNALSFGLFTTEFAGLYTCNHVIFIYNELYIL